MNYIPKDAQITLLLSYFPESIFTIESFTSRKDRPIFNAITYLKDDKVNLNCLLKKILAVNFPALHSDSTSNLEHLYSEFLIHPGLPKAFNQDVIVFLKQLFDKADIQPHHLTIDFNKNLPDSFFDTHCQCIIQ